MKNHICFLAVFFITFSLSVAAETIEVQILKPIRNQVSTLAVGSLVELRFIERNTALTSLFLGRMITSDKREEKFLFLDLDKTRVYMFKGSSIKLTIPKSSAQAITSPVAQAGGTCTAYAIFHYWKQMYTTGFNTPGLENAMGSEANRMRFFETALTRYYGVERAVSLPGIMKKDGELLGFNCKTFTSSDPKKASEYIFNKTAEGKPVLLEFNIGPDMLTSTYEITDFESNLTSDPRLWLPRRIGQRNAGGHAIVAIAAFVAKGRRKILVLDSDWAEPRVWDLDKYMGMKTAVKEMLFYSCN